MFNGSSMCIGLWTGDFPVTCQARHIINSEPIKSNIIKLSGSACCSLPAPWAATSILHPSLLSMVTILQPYSPALPHWLCEYNTTACVDSLFECLLALPLILCAANTFLPSRAPIAFFILWPYFTPSLYKVFSRHHFERVPCVTGETHCPRDTLLFVSTSLYVSMKSPVTKKKFDP